MRTENNAVYSLGTIKITSGRILVSDPCYLDSAQHMFNFVEGCRNGIWKTEAEVSDEGDWGERVAVLSARCEEPYTAWKEIGIAGVDSGQMSIMDASHLQEWGGDDRGHGWDPDAYAGDFSYQGACEITLRDGDVRGGLLAKRMAVSSSGYGDGSYPVSVGYDRNGNVVAVKIEFIWEDEGENED